jgi:hypothetical protein
MKKLLLASILMVFGASAQAVVVVGDTVCDGTYPSITCLTDVTCNATATGKCVAVLDSFEGETICLPIDGTVRVLGSDTEGETAPHSCTWTVTDVGDSSSLEVTVDGSDGLPVELQSLSVE